MIALSFVYPQACRCLEVCNTISCRVGVSIKVRWNGGLRENMSSRPGFVGVSVDQSSIVCSFL